MDIYPSGIKVPNEPQEGFGKPVANKGYTPGTFGVTFGKKPDPKEMISSAPNVGGEVRNPKFQELLQMEKMLKSRGFTLERDDKGITEINLPSDLYTQEELEEKLGEKLTLAAAQTKVELDILSNLVEVSGKYSNLHKEAELLEGKLKNPITLAVLEQLSGETKRLIEEIKDKPLGTKLDELRQKISEFEKIVNRAKDEAAKIPTPTVAPEAQIKNEEPVGTPLEAGAPTVPKTSLTAPENTQSVPERFEVGQTFLLPKDDDHEEATWEVIKLISQEGAMMMKQVDGSQKGRTEKFYYKQLKGFLKRIEAEKQQTATKTAAEKPAAGTSKVSTAPKINEGSSVLRSATPTEKNQEQIIRLIGGRKIKAEWTKEQEAGIKGSEEVLQKTRAQTEVRAKFEDMFTHDQKAFISLYTKTSADGVTYTENETFRKHPYRDVIRQVFFANNIPVTYLTHEEIGKKEDVQKEQEHSRKTTLGSVYNPARDSAQAAGRMDIFSKPKEITSVGGMVQNSKTVPKEAAAENPLRETILGVEKNTEKNPQEKLKKIASVLSARIKNLSNNTNNLVRGQLSWVVFAIAVGGAAALTTGYLKNLEGKGPVLVSESLKKNEVVIKDTWRKYFHEGKKDTIFKDFAEDISKLSANQLKETLIQKYAKSYFDGTNNQRQTLLALGMFGDLVQNDTTKGTYDHLPDVSRAELSHLWGALNDVSMATSGEKLQAKTYEAAIEEVKEKVTNKEK